MKPLDIARLYLGWFACFLIGVLLGASLFFGASVFTPAPGLSAVEANAVTQVEGQLTGYGYTVSDPVVIARIAKDHNGNRDTIIHAEYATINGSLTHGDLLVMIVMTQKGALIWADVMVPSGLNVYGN